MPANNQPKLAHISPFYNYKSEYRVRRIVCHSSLGIEKGELNPLCSESNAFNFEALRVESVESCP